jgi:hypothetical protein
MAHWDAEGEWAGFELKISEEDANKVATEAVEAPTIIEIIRLTKSGA